MKRIMVRPRRPCVAGEGDFLAKGAHFVHRVFRSCRVNRQGAVNMRIALTTLFGLIAMAGLPVRADLPDAVPQALEILRESGRLVRRFALDNGMVALVKPDRSAPTVSIQIWLSIGSIHEQEFLGAGISHAIEHMLFKGTETYGPNEISHRIDAVGGVINAYTTLDRTVFFTDLPSRHWQVGFDAVADAIMHATFPESEWDLEREVIFREFAMGYDDPRRELSKLMWRTAFREHPYRFPVIGYEDVFGALTREDLATFYRRHYTPDNMILVIAGDIEPDAVEAHVRETFAGFSRRARPDVVLPVEPPQTQPREGRRTGAWQTTRLAMAHHSVSLGHPDAVALDVLAAVLGRGRSARLVRILREEERLVDEISAWSYTPKQPGLFAVTASFDPAREPEVRARLDTLLAALPDEDFQDEEIETAIRGVLVSELSSLATARGQADSIAAGEFFAGDYRFAETYLERLRSVTADDLRAVAARYLTPANRSIAVLAPESAPVVAADSAPDPAALIRPPVRRETATGIPIVVREDHRLPFVHVTIAMQGGLLAETPETSGITAAAAELLLRGTGTRDAQAIAAFTDRRGGSLSAFSGRNSFGLRARFLSSDLDDFLALLADCLLDSRFPDDELEQQQRLQTAAVLQQQERPMFQAQRHLLEAMHPGHPYSLNPQGTPESIAALTREAVAGHVENLLGPDNMAIAVFGHVEPDAIVERLESLLAPLAGRTARIPERSVSGAPTTQRIVTPEPRRQAIVLTGFPGVDVFDPRYEAVSLLDRALSGLSSTLAESVRGAGALAYFVGAWHQPGLVPGEFVLYTGTRADAVEAVEARFADEIRRLTTEGLAPAELERARNRLLAEHERQLQDSGSLAMQAALNELYGLGYDHGFTLPERLAAVTAADVRAAAADLLDPDRQVTSIVLPDADR